MMHALTEGITPFLAWVIRTSLQASVLVLIVLALQAAMRDRLAPRWRDALWLLVLARLVLPWAPESHWSLYNVFPSWQPDRVASVSGELFASGATLVAIPPSEAFGLATARADPPRAASPAETMRSERARVVAIDDAPVASAAPPLLAIVEDAPPPSVTPPSHDAAIRPIDALAAAWLAGVVFLIGLALVRSLRLSSIVRRGRELSAAPWRDVLDECRRAMGVSARTRIVETPAVNTPALCGVWRPRLLFPAGALDALGGARLRHVFLHELAHVRRLDIARNWLCAILAAIHWFNPLVWYAFHRMRGDRELVCDALALERLGPGEADAYGRTIIHLLESLARPRRVPSLAGVLESHHHIQRRIAMIANYDARPRRLPLLAAALLLAVGCMTLTNARSDAQDAAPSAATVPAPTPSTSSIESTASTPSEASVPTLSELPSIGRLMRSESDATADATDSPEIARIKLERAKRLYEVVSQRHAQGRATSGELIEAQTALRVAEAEAARDPLAAARARLEGAKLKLEATRQQFEVGRASQEAMIEAESALQIAQAAVRATESQRGRSATRARADVAPRKAAVAAEAGVAQGELNELQAMVKRLVSENQALRDELRQLGRPQAGAVFGASRAEPYSASASRMTLLRKRHELTVEESLDLDAELLKVRRIVLGVGGEAGDEQRTAVQRESAIRAMQRELQEQMAQIEAELNELQQSQTRMNIAQ
jgi:bla regulator protein BlaR1